MEIRQIRYALAVAREHSFTRASVRLNLSQSAISEQVRLLEAQIGFPLFRRTGRGIETTERGRSFLDEAQRVMGEVLGLDDTARRLLGAAGGGFALGTASGMAQLFMPRLFGRFERLPADLRLEILTAPTRNIFRDLQEERLDAGIALESDPGKVPAGVTMYRLGETELALILPPSHRLARSTKPVDIGRLGREPFIMSELTVGYGEVVMALFTDLGMRPFIRAIADNIETMKVIVQSGAGLAIVPRAAVATEAALGILKALAIAPARAVSFSLYRRRQPMARKKEACFAVLKEVLAG